MRGSFEISIDSKHTLCVNYRFMRRPCFVSTHRGTVYVIRFLRWFEDWRSVQPTDWGNFFILNVGSREEENSKSKQTLTLCKSGVFQEKIPVAELTNGEPEQ